MFNESLHRKWVPGEPEPATLTPPGLTPGESDLRRLLLDAARALLREPETTLDLRKVAERGGKSRTAPYLVFGKTEEGGGLAALRVAVAAEGFAELGSLLTSARHSTPDPEEALHRLVTTYLAFARDQPRLFRLMFGGEVAQELESVATGEAGQRERALLRAARRRVEEAFLEATSAVDPAYLRESGAGGRSSAGETMSGALWALVHGVAMLTIDGQWEQTALGEAGDAAGLAERTLRFLTTASLKSMGRAKEALERAQRGKAVSSRLADEAGFYRVAEGRTRSEAYEEAKAEAVADAKADAEVRTEAEPESEVEPDVRAGASEASVSERMPPDFRAAEELHRGVAERDHSYGPLSSPAPPESFREASPKNFFTRASHSEHPLAPPSRDKPVSTGLRRARGMVDRLRTTRILWVDDRPGLSRHEERMLTELGVEVLRARDTASALRLLREEDVDLILSDIERDGDPQAGVKDLAALRREALGAPLVFYVGQVDPGRPTPPGAFGITAKPEELLHLVMDVVERIQPRVRPVSARSPTLRRSR